MLWHNRPAPTFSLDSLGRNPVYWVDIEWSYFKANTGRRYIFFFVNSVSSNPRLKRKPHKVVPYHSRNIYLNKSALKDPTLLRTSQTPNPKYSYRYIESKDTSSLREQSNVARTKSSWNWKSIIRGAANLFAPLLPRDSLATLAKRTWVFRAQIFYRKKNEEIP